MPQMDLKPLGIILHAGRLYMGNFLSLVILGLAGESALVLVALAPAVGVSSWVAGALLGLALFVHLWAGAAMIIAASATYHGGRPSSVRCLLLVPVSFRWYAPITLLYGLLCLLGSIFLVVPGIYCATLYSLAGYVAVLEEPLGVEGAFARSAELVKREPWRIFWTLLALTAFTAAGYLGAYSLHRVSFGASFFSTIGWTVLIWPFWTLAHLGLYESLTGEEAENG